MAVEIRCASLESAKSDLIPLFKRHLSADFDEQRFDWLYKGNPVGPARAWLAHDAECGTIVGAAAAFPRRFWFDGQRKTGWVLGDFCLVEGHRSLGPALQLQRACLGANEAPCDFCYDFPSRAMMAVYKRLGTGQTSALVRWAKPIRIEERLQPFVRSKHLAKALGGIGNVILKTRGWKGKSAACEIARQEGPCGEEFTVLDRELGSKGGVRAEKTAEFLNWRFLGRSNPAHEIFTARREGSFIGYVVLRNEREDARIVDFASLEGPDVIAALLDAAVNRLRECGAKTANLAAADSHPCSKVFEQAGFSRRETSPVIVVVRNNAGVSTDCFQTNCYLMEGDRDS
jgi:hypothetical protein